MIDRGTAVGIFSKVLLRDNAIKSLIKLFKYLVVDCVGQITIRIVKGLKKKG